MFKLIESFLLWSKKSLYHIFNFHLLTVCVWVLFCSFDVTLCVPVPSCFITEDLYNISVALFAPYKCLSSRIFQALFACLFFQTNFNTICQVQKICCFSHLLTHVIFWHLSPQQNRNMQKELGKSWRRGIYKGQIELLKCCINLQ